MNIDLSDSTNWTIGDRVIRTRDGVEKQGKLVNVLLDPRRTQITYTIKCDGQKIIQTDREFVKFDGEVDVSNIPQTTDNFNQIMIKDIPRVTATLDAPQSTKWKARRMNPLARKIELHALLSNEDNMWTWCAP